MENTEKLKNIGLVVRALVLSRKQPVYLRDVVREYPEVEFQPLPYRELGFTNAENLLRATGEFHFSQNCGLTCIEAKHNPKTAHIAQLVQQQRPSKSRRIHLPQPPRRFVPALSRHPNLYSRKILTKFPTLNNFLASQNRANSAPANGDRNNNKLQNNNSSLERKYSSIQQSMQKIRSTSYTEDYQYPTDVREKLRNQFNPSESAKYKQPVTDAPGKLKNNITPSPKSANIKKQEEQSVADASEKLKNKITPTPEPDLPEKLNSKRSEEMLKQQEKKSVQMPARPILGINVQKTSTNTQIIQTKKQQEKIEVVKNSQQSLIQQAASPHPQVKRNIQSRLQIAKQELSKVQIIPKEEPPKLQAQRFLEQKKSANTVVNKNHKNAATLKTSSVQNRLKISIIDDMHSGNDAERSPTQVETPSAGSEKLENTKIDAVHSKDTSLTSAQRISKILDSNMNPNTALHQFCIEKDFPPPEYSVLKSKFSTSFTCRVRIGQSIYSTYPMEYATEALSHKAVANKALTELRKQFMKPQLPMCTDSDEEIIEKFYEELLEHPTGRFFVTLNTWFEEKYQQVLPGHWQMLLQNCRKFRLEDISSRLIIFANTEWKEEEEKQPIAMQIERILLPWTLKHWNVYITYCASTTEIWARLFGEDYNTRYEELLDLMEAYMHVRKVRPMSIECRDIYLTYIVDAWHRVRVQEIDSESDAALCFFLDYGGTDWLPLDKLYVCDSRFLKVPAQAVLFSLFGLEDFASHPNARRVLEDQLLHKSFVCLVSSNAAEFYSTDSETSGKVRVVLYDTSSQDDEINLNPILLNRINRETPQPTLKQSGVSLVSVTHITDVGDVYIHIKNEDWNFVQNMLERIVKSKFKRERFQIKREDLKNANIFLIYDDKCEKQNWYRGVLADADTNPNDREINIFYIDYGKTRRTDISKIYLLESLSAALSKFPRQAIRVRLDNIPDITTHIVGRMRALMPLHGEFLAKMSKYEEIPKVTIYHRFDGPSGPDTLCNVNDTLRIEDELERASELLPTPTSPDFNKLRHQLLSSSLESISEKNGRSPYKSSELQKLTPYSLIPLIGDFFNVRVSMASNPTNFYVQPYEEYPRFSALMKELQEYCEKNEKCIPVDAVEIGQAYAAKNSDGFYQRVTVVSFILGTNIIHVCFCDFGDIATVKNNELKVLPPKFRRLPKMAIQARLHGIVPINFEWTLDDCMRFRKLTVGNKFVSVIKGISYEEQNNSPDGVILDLELIDVTETDTDVFINDLLIHEDRAIIANGLN